MTVWVAIGDEVIGSDEVILHLSGDFEDLAEKSAYAQALAERLNACTKVRADLWEDAERRAKAQPANYLLDD